MASSWGRGWAGGKDTGVRSAQETSWLSPPGGRGPPTLSLVVCRVAGGFAPLTTACSPGHPLCCSAGWDALVGWSRVALLGAGLLSLSTAAVLGPAAAGGRPVRCGPCSGIPGLYPLDARSNPLPSPSCAVQNCLQGRGQNHPHLRISGLGEGEVVDKGRARPEDSARWLGDLSRGEDRLVPLLGVNGDEPRMGPSLAGRGASPAVPVCKPEPFLPPYTLGVRHRSARKPQGHPRDPAPWPPAGLTCQRPFRSPRTGCF